MSDYEHTGRRIEAEVTVRATPQQAWEAWADPEKLAGWFVDRATGQGRTGETMTWFFDRFGMEMPYRVLESVPGERIVFGPGSDTLPPFVLEVVMTRADGDTRIRLVNSGFSEDADFDAQFEGMDSGWRMALGLLKEYLERYFGQPKAQFLALRPADVDLDTVLPWFTEGPKLVRWLGTLTSGPAVGGPGRDVSMEMADGGSLQGRVLARTARELALSWFDIDGTLELKCFQQGPQPMLCIRGYGWGMAAEDAEALEARMGAALERLAAALDGA